MVTDLGILSEGAIDKSKGGITMAVKAHPTSLEDANVIRTALTRTTAAHLEIKLNNNQKAAASQDASKTS